MNFFNLREKVFTTSKCAFLIAGENSFLKVATSPMAGMENTKVIPLKLMCMRCIMNTKVLCPIQENDEPSNVIQSLP